MIVRTRLVLGTGRGCLQGDSGNTLVEKADSGHRSGFQFTLALRGLSTYRRLGRVALGP